MKYLASDITKKARIAADLVNSDFITWYEEVSLLNDAYIGLYQHLVDLNDPSFVKIIETRDNVYVLPPDFFQLRAITLIKNGYSTPVLRRSFSESYKSLSYEIIGDELHFYSNFVNQNANGGTYHIEYYSTPNTLTFKPKSEKLDYTYDIETMLVHDKDFYIGISDNTLKLYKDGEIRDLSINGAHSAFLTSIRALVFGSEAWYTIDRETAITGTPEDFDYNSYLPIIFEDGQIGYIEATGKVKLGSFEIGEIDVEDLVNDNYFNKKAVFFTDMTLSDIWYVNMDDNGTNPYVIHNDYPVITADNSQIKMKQCVYREGCLYGYYSNTFITIFEDNNYSLVSLPKNIETIGLLDENTGLSFIGKVGDYAYIYPWVEDTLLDYTNSFFFQVLAYALAIQYKIKQNADASGLSKIYEEYLNTFDKTLPQDVYMPTRINNVYGC